MDTQDYVRVSVQAFAAVVKIGRKKIATTIEDGGEPPKPAIVWKPSGGRPQLMVPREWAVKRGLVDAEGEAVRG